MNQPNRIYDEETQLVESIHKMSNRLYFGDSTNQTRHSIFLREVIQDMQQKLDLIRGNRVFSN
jgi:hypothetical protein